MLSLLLAFLLLFIFIYYYNKISKQKKESPFVKEDLDIMGFHEDVLAIIDQYSERVEKLKIFDVESGEEKQIEGMSFVIDADHEDETLTELNFHLKKKGFYTFVTDKDHTNHEYIRIGIMRVTDPYKVMEYKQTNGSNYDVETSDIIEKLKKWEEKYSFEVTGIDFDWIEIKFHDVPTDLNHLVSEVHTFCPDAVDDLTGSTEELAASIQQTKRLFLWWD